MNTKDVAVLSSLLQSLAQALPVLLRDVELALEILAARRRQGGAETESGGAIGDLVDDSRFTVHWNGRECQLGPTLPFRLFRHLALARDRYVPFERLLDDVWGGLRTTNALRSVVYVLRKRLKAAGMPELARAVEGKPGHYRFSTGRLPAPLESDVDPT